MGNGHIMVIGVAQVGLYKIEEKFIPQIQPQNGRIGPQLHDVQLDKSLLSVKSTAQAR
jgi:hypothetical protein